MGSGVIDHGPRGRIRLRAVTCDDDQRSLGVNENLISPQHPWLTLIVPLLHYARLRPQLVNYMQLSRVLQDTVYRALWQGAVVEETLRHTTRLLQILVGDVG